MPGRCCAGGSVSANALGSIELRHSGTVLRPAEPASEDAAVAMLRKGGMTAACMTTKEHRGIVSYDMVAEQPSSYLCSRQALPLIQVR
jgi:hypothetical protein